MTVPLKNVLIHKRIRATIPTITNIKTLIYETPKHKRGFTENHSNGTYIIKVNKNFRKEIYGSPNQNLVDFDSLTGSARYFIPEEPPCFTKSSMSPKEWDEIFEELYKMTSENTIE